MQLLFNDASIAGQFADTASFCTALGRVMRIRNMARRFRCELQLARRVGTAQVTTTLKFLQAIQVLDRDKRGAVLQWVTKQGPFWDDNPQHSSNEYFECNDQCVTECAIAEAGFRSIRGAATDVASATPSDWTARSLRVRWMADAGVQEADIANYSTPEDIERVLASAPPELATWEDVGTFCQARCPALAFGEGAFHALQWVPFHPGAAARIVALCIVLEKMAAAFDDLGGRSTEGNDLYQTYFVGDKAWFSDSSDKEKRRFGADLTFPDARASGGDVFCPMHGKVKWPQIRLHFAWSFTRDERPYIAYVGPKITKQ